MAKIDWKDFESKYWTPEKGEAYELVLANWRQETRSYDDGKTEKPVLVFDVKQAGNVEFVPPKTFVTSAASFAADARPIIEDAEANLCDDIKVMVEYKKDKKYRVIDVRKLRGE